MVSWLVGYSVAFESEMGVVMVYRGVRYGKIVDAWDEIFLSWPGDR